MMNFLFGHCNDPRYSVLTLGELTCGVETLLAGILAIMAAVLVVAAIAVFVLGTHRIMGFLNR